jgi:nucleoid-associated protein YejK
MLIVKHVIVHYLSKNQHNNNASVELSDSFLGIDESAQKLIEELNGRYSRQNSSKITYAKFGPATIFSDRFNEFHSTQSDENFIEFTKQAANDLCERIKAVSAAKGGYVVFAHFENIHDYVGVYIIREKKGVLFTKDEATNTYKIGDAFHIDFEKIAMGCRVNKDSYTEGSRRYLSFIDSKKDEVSKFFTDWVSAEDNIDNAQDTKVLYQALKNIPCPVDESGSPISTEELLNRAYSFIKEQPGRLVDIAQLSSVLYQNESAIVDHLLEGGIEINGQFKADTAVLKKFATIRLMADKITLSFPLNAWRDKVVTDPDHPDIITIHSAALAQKLREEGYE